MTDASQFPADEMIAPQQPIDSSLPAEPIVATAGRYYRNMRYLMTLGLMVFAGFFAYDGFVRYPETNRKINETNAAYDAATTEEDKASLGKLQRQLGAPHTETDIALQKVLAVVLPVVAVGFLVLILRRSRGEIRLENDTLHVPGHPPIPLASVTSIDSALWKKKGIAIVHYNDGGKARSFRLDDFIYQQKPIDTIYDRLTASTASTMTA